ncbi:putative 4-hydroxy-4-methyl-2-oxoglutarate aldolase 3 isoform X1 [Arachis stenosperma]|uniref:putative 4-hydroxy-4-methyl-2-oxoglutarate aldolase 3 isoform X1 n=2 Tax=Arachis stenosperma TaxID=217475 RepID=UPI0025AD281A|nr:putative 4-hydroxy-4-methyl-2-oxoglutarate aldolase 3 isoform X1 [Arachis stenosperma]
MHTDPKSDHVLFIYIQPSSSSSSSTSSVQTLKKQQVKMAALATAEICDTNATHITSGDLRVLHPVFQVYGQARAFSGPIVTLKVFEDNVIVRAMLETKGEGRVLVIDGGGSMRCALVGGNLGQLAQSNGWAGIVVNGCIRDVDEINACDIGVRALSSHPLKSNKKGTGDKHVPIYVGGAFIRDGEWLYADSDGIIVSKFELSV